MEPYGSLAPHIFCFDSLLSDLPFAGRRKLLAGTGDPTLAAGLCAANLLTLFLWKRKGKKPMEDTALPNLFFPGIEETGGGLIRTVILTSCFTGVLLSGRGEKRNPDFFCPRHHMGRAFMRLSLRRSPAGRGAGPPLARGDALDFYVPGKKKNGRIKKAGV